VVETVTRSAPTASSLETTPVLPKRKSPLRLFTSTFLITVILFFAANYAIEKIDPLERLFYTGLTGARQHIFVSKLPKLLASPESPDVLVMGTSVSLYPAVRADDELAGKKARWDFWYERNVILPYDKAQFLESKLTQLTGHKVSVANASVAGALVSDQYLILKKFLSSGKKPKSVVLCLSPRDFLDNARTDLESTPTHNVLNDWSSLPELINKGASWQSVTTAALGNLSSYYEHRQEYSHFLTQLAAKTFDRPVNLFEATKKIEARRPDSLDLPVEPAKGKRDTFFNPSNNAVYERPVNKLYHLDEYKAMYLPMNVEQYRTQKGYFTKFLKLAKDYQVPVIIVNTPLPVENLNLLPIKFQEKYRAMLSEKCSQNGATYLDPNSNNSYSTAEDFEDASHMATAGGVKFYTSIFETLKTANIKL